MSAPTDAGASLRREPRVLLVEDDDSLREALGSALAARFPSLETQASGAAAMARLRDADRPAPDVVVTDLRLGPADAPDGLAVLRAARACDPRTPVILMTAFGTVDDAVEAMRLGAADFLQKPFPVEELILRVARAVEQREAGPGAGSATGEDPLVAESGAMRRVVELARQVAGTRSTLLLTGETGTGKEVVATLVHRASTRAHAPFVKVNCAALPETLLESELFGHERGAFTGADRRRVGRFEQASGGTLFLDEVGDTTPATQVKLLRVLQDQEFHRLGGTATLRTDARIVAATNRDLGAAIRDGRFREDLYFRLNVIGIHLPPLRERPEDAEALALHFLRRLARETGRPVRGFAPGALERIRAHAWPGNVRELRNAVERAVLLARGEFVESRDLGLVPEAAEARPRVELPEEGVSLRDVERELVLAALRRTGFVQKDAAALLRVSPRKLNYMIRRMGLTHPRWRRNRGVGEPG